ncbi:hypothetical protein, partial [Streptomyces sp. NPDC090036]|uniref:hypothetical protein n=1 Tax=Streptomyces sp. NPDC090036 TaxID=3365926 RepID=UPI00381E3EEC
MTLTLGAVLAAVARTVSARTAPSRGTPNPAIGGKANPQGVILPAFVAACIADFRQPLRALDAGCG